MGAFFIIVSISVIGYALWRKRGLVRGDYCMIWDGQLWSTVKMAYDEQDGSWLVKGVPYTPDMLTAVSGSPKVFGRQVYVLAADSLQMATHQQFASLALRTIKGRLFKAGGDVVRLLQIVAAAIVMAAAIYSWSVFSSVNEQLADQRLLLNEVTTTLRKPLVVQPAPPPLATPGGQ